MKRSQQLISICFVAVIAGLLILSSLDKRQFSEFAFVNESPTNEQMFEKEKSVSPVISRGDFENLPELSDEELVAIMNAFIDILIQDIDDQYRVIGLDTKAELIDEFSSIAIAEAVEPYVHFYYYEQPDGLYIVPTELPPWFVEGQPYQKEMTDQGTVKITQDNFLEIYGHYRIEIELAYQKGWKIINIEHPPVEDDTIMTDTSETI